MVKGRVLNLGVHLEEEVEYDITIVQIVLLNLFHLRYVKYFAKNIISSLLECVSSTARTVFVRVKFLE